jgi:hypothetical protein
LFSTATLAALQDAEDINLDIIRTKAARLTRTLQSIEFQATMEVTRKTKDGRVVTETTSTKYYDQNGHFRCETRVENRQSKRNLDVISLYNGNKYQFVDKHKKSLNRSNSAITPNASGSLNPLVVPYYFLWDIGSTQVWSSAKTDQLWESKFRLAKYQGTVREEDRLSAVVEVPGPVPGSMYRVFFSPDLEYFPVKSLVYSGGSPVGSIVVRDYRKILSHGETVVIPLAVDLDQQEGGESLSLRIVINPSSLKVNEPIPEDLFTYPESQAETVNDADAKTSMRGGRVLSSRVRPPRPHTSRWLVVSSTVFGLVIIGVIATAILSRRFRVR